MDRRRSKSIIFIYDKDETTLLSLRNFFEPSQKKKKKYLHTLLVGAAFEGSVPPAAWFSERRHSVSVDRSIFFLV